MRRENRLIYLLFGESILVLHIILTEPWERVQFLRSLLGIFKKIKEAREEEDLKGKSNLIAEIKIWGMKFKLDLCRIFFLCLRLRRVWNHVHEIREKLGLSKKWVTYIIMGNNVKFHHFNLILEIACIRNSSIKSARWGIKAQI